MPCFFPTFGGLELFKTTEFDLYNCMSIGGVSSVVEETFPPRIAKLHTIEYG